MDGSHSRRNVEFVADAKTWDSVKTHLRERGISDSFLNTRIYYDEYVAILEGESGVTGSRGWGQWVIVITPSDRVHSSEEIAAVVPEMTRSDDDLQLPAFATGGKTMRVTETTRTMKLTDDSEWATDNDICLDCLGPEVLFTNFRVAVVVIDRRVKNNDAWTVGGSQPGSYIAGFDFTNHLQYRLNPTQQVVFAELAD